jgi:hypothetical protein
MIKVSTSWSPKRLIPLRHSLQPFHSRVAVIVCIFVPSTKQLIPYFCIISWTNSLSVPVLAPEPSLSMLPRFLLQSIRPSPS